MLLLMPIFKVMSSYNKNINYEEIINEVSLNVASNDIGLYLGRLYPDTPQEELSFELCKIPIIKIFNRNAKLHNTISKYSNVWIESIRSFKYEDGWDQEEFWNLNEMDRNSLSLLEREIENYNFDFVDVVMIDFIIFLKHSPIAFIKYDSKNKDIEYLN